MQNNGPKADKYHEVGGPYLSPYYFYVITPIPELSLINFQYIDQEANLHSLIYLISLAIVRLIKTDLS